MTPWSKKLTVFALLYFARALCMTGKNPRGPNPENGIIKWALYFHNDLSHCKFVCTMGVRRSQWGENPAAGPLVFAPHLGWGVGPQFKIKSHLFVAFAQPPPQLIPMGSNPQTGVLLLTSKQARKRLLRGGPHIRPPPPPQ